MVDWSNTASEKEANLHLLHDFSTCRIVGIYFDADLLSHSENLLRDLNREPSVLFVTHAEETSLKFLLITERFRF